MWVNIDLNCEWIWLGLIKWLIYNFVFLDFKNVLKWIYVFLIKSNYRFRVKLKNLD